MVIKQSGLSFIKFLESVCLIKITKKDLKQVSKKLKNINNFFKSFTSMAEWSNATVSKAVKTKGSNPFAGISSELNLNKQHRGNPNLNRLDLNQFTIGIKNVFNLKEKPTLLGLDSPTFQFESGKNAVIIELLTKIAEDNNWLIRFKNSNCLPFCVGTIDFRFKQKNQLYAGGSSSQSVKAIQDKKTDVELCTDTGGSAIFPAARANLIAFKPTYGRITRAGLVPMCNKLDVISLMSNCPTKIAKIFSILDQEFLEDETCLKKGLRTREVQELNQIYIDPALFESQAYQKIKAFYNKNFKEIKLIERKLNIPWATLEGFYMYVLAPDFYSNMCAFDGFNHQKNTPNLREYCFKKIKKTRTNELNKEIKSRIITGAIILAKAKNFQVKIKKITDYLKSQMEGHWILPIAKDLYIPASPKSKIPNQEYCFINNLLGRPSCTYNAVFSGAQGFQLSFEPNKDYTLLKHLEKSFERAQNFN